MALSRARRPPVLSVAALGAGTACVLALHVVTAVGLASGARRWFDVALENNVPTAWSVLLLLVLALRLWQAGPGARVLAAGAAALAVDEWVGWHEHLRTAGRALAAVGVALPTYAWVLPGVVVAALALVVAGPWLRELPDDLRTGLLTGAAVFCAGALGVEAVSGLVHLESGLGPLWQALTTLEEGLEMAGVLVAVSAVSRESSKARQDAAGGARALTGPAAPWRSRWAAGGPRP